MNKVVLGRGIGALIPDGSTPQAQMGSADLIQIPIDRVRPNPDQPRKEADPEGLTELSNSIRSEGILQPVLVQPRGDEYELIAGERRVRAARIAGLTHVPARVLRNVDDQKRTILALVENLQREDLNPIDEASGYRELTNRFGLSHEDLATAVGKDRSTIANALRILKLPEGVRSEIAAGRLTAGHGRALLGLSDSEQITSVAEKAVKEAWSVRRLERELSVGRPKRGRPLKTGGRHRWGAVEDALKRKFGTQVTISHRLGKGKIIFEYYSEEDLARLVDLFEVRLD
jgi:ParB family chromosome partitioning protein